MSLVSRRARAAFTPGVESLENRDVPAAVIQSGNVMHVIGGPAADLIRIVDNGTAGGVQVVQPNGAIVPATRAIREIRVTSGNGADRVLYTLTRPLTAPNRLTVISTGNGNDTILVTLNGGAASGAYLDFSINSGWHNDVIQVNAVNADIAVGGTVRWGIQGDDQDDRITTSYVGQLRGQLLNRLEGNRNIDRLTSTYRLETGSIGVLRTHHFASTNFDYLTMLVREERPTDPVLIDALIDGGPLLDRGTRTANVRAEEVEVLRTVA